MKLKAYLYLTVGIAFAAIVGNNAILRNKNSKLNKEIEIQSNNIEAYIGLLNDAKESNNVLRLKASALSSSKDSILQKLDSVRKELKIKDSALKIAMANSTVVEVSEKEPVIINDSCEFKKEFKPNALTILKIELKNDSLMYKLKIENNVYLYVYTSRLYKNQGKSFFKRLVTFDWKKITYYKYDIINENDLIKTDKIRVIENTESK